MIIAVANTLGVTPNVVYVENKAEGAEKAMEAHEDSKESGGNYGTDEDEEEEEDGISLKTNGKLVLCLVQQIFTRLVLKRLVG